VSELSASISVHNRQRAIKLDVAHLQAFAERALAHVSKIKTARLSEIDVVLISDKRVSALHRRFMNILGPTDVITFQHGEIFISVETAWRQARQHNTSTLQEIELYIVHGLLHLAGFDDKTAAAARIMRKIQTRIVRCARTVQAEHF
jgi:probable rRNA maturation factor